ncbi:peptidase S1C, Do [gamma proteobacterium HTCC5015]|nr:peptidase S1C, Do [gamma proteobacterium HTCC5015]
MPSFVLRIWVLLFALLSFSVSARSLPEFTDLVEDNAPAVVNISTTKKTGGMAGLPIDREQLERQLEQLGPWGELFRHYFDAPQGGGRGAPIPRDQHHSLGSGFIISDDGYIITNNHVIEGADEVVVKLNDRSEYIAEVIGSDADTDIALLKVEADKSLPTVELGDSQSVNVGEWVLAIGSPFGFDASVTAGIVSAKARALPNENYVPFLQTDVAINPGNSGGPLFNLDGEVVGVNSQIYSRTGGYMGLSFAVPIDVAMDVVEQIKESGSVSRGWLGVAIQEVTLELAESFGLDKPRGALVASVMPDSPAEKAGIETGDIILSVDDKDVRRSSALPPIVGRHTAGDSVDVEVLRQGKKRTIAVELGELASGKSGQRSDRSHSEPTSDNRLGMALGAVDERKRRALKLPDGGVEVKQLVAGAAANAGLRVGDVITHINNQAINSAQQANRLVAEFEGGRVVPFLVARPYGREFLAVRIPK